jgi:glutamine amidotransferase
LIAIVDFGLGNLRSVQKALDFLGFTSVITLDPSVVRQADKIVIPGVGAFAAAMEGLEAQSLVDELKESIVGRKKPTLGICLGMQILADISFEHGRHKGLSLVHGDVLPLRDLAPGFRVPHIGWSEVEFKDCDMFKNIPQRSSFYFVHSYYFSPANLGDAVAWAQFASPFTCSLQHDNIWATQFHPEKSQKVGLQLLKNFGEI